MPIPEPEWLTAQDILDAHEVLSQPGDRSGPVRKALLESAIGRPQWRFLFDPDADLACLAALYCAGINYDHAFVDGNKRASYAAIEVFLDLNGCRIETTDARAVSVVRAVAGKVRMSENMLAEWIRRRLRPVEPAPADPVTVTVGL